MSSYYIGILQLKKELDDTVEGFKAGLDQSGLDQSQFQIDYRNVQENVPSFGQEADDLVAAGADLIFACTTPAAKFAKEATEFYGVPVVFAPVYDPVAVGLVQGWSGSGNHLAGVSGKVDVAEKVTLMADLVPNLTRVAAFYDPDDPNSILEIADLEQAAPGLGLKVSPVKLHDPEKLKTAAIPAGSQFVFVPIGRMIEDNFSALAKNCLAQGVPLCGPNLHTVREGGSCCVDSLHYQLGVQSGEIAAQILQGQDPAGIPIGRPRVTQRFVNGEALTELGLTVQGLKKMEIL